jgi:hypothetical protein
MLVISKFSHIFQVIFYFFKICVFLFSLSLSFYFSNLMLFVLNSYIFINLCLNLYSFGWSPVDEKLKRFPLSSMYTYINYNTVYDYILFHYSPLSHHILFEAKIKNNIIIWGGGFLGVRGLWSIGRKYRWSLTVGLVYVVVK